MSLSPTNDIVSLMSVFLLFFLLIHSFDLLIVIGFPNKYVPLGSAASAGRR